ncbi:DUF6346 domain-containing protein [Krasilnikovia sp. MM14-A1004]|uniref:DUF6346 domain-containing protein n=1 Tax=Krasilnikovia sp. MM14-A1004 TaxID=3373541 RepID=UPI00399C84E9
MRKLQQRLDKIKDNNQAADALAGRRSEVKPESASPVAPERSRGRRRGWLIVLGMVVFGFVFGELALTVQGWSGPDFSDARRVGKATVVSCERRGPIGWGIGYWDQCTADVVWDGGFSGRYAIDRRNFFHADEVGTTVTIGEGAGSRGGGVVFSRPELPHRPAVVALGWGLAVIASIPILLLLGGTFVAARDAIRGVSKR